MVLLIFQYSFNLFFLNVHIFVPFSDKYVFFSSCFIYALLSALTSLVHYFSTDSQSFLV